MANIAKNCNTIKEGWWTTRVYFNESASHFNMHWIYKQLDKWMEIYMCSPIYASQQHTQFSSRVLGNRIYWKYERVSSFLLIPFFLTQIHLNRFFTAADHTLCVGCNYFIVRLEGGCNFGIGVKCIVLCTARSIQFYQICMTFCLWNRATRKMHVAADQNHWNNSWNARE